MNPRLVVLTGTLAGQTRALGAERVALGRDALCEVRFDPTADTEVSARHAELRMENGVAIVRDTNSTNGVYVNGTRVRGEQALADGDVVRLGARGPKIRLEAQPARAAQGSTTERIAVAVHRQTRGLRTALIACIALVAAGAGFGFWSSRRADAVRASELELLRRRNDSLSAAIDRDLHAMTGRLAGLDSALAAAKRESDALRARLAASRGDAGVTLLSAQIARAESRRGAIAAAARMDYEAIARASGKAVVMIAVEMPDGKLFSGSGIGVAAEGVIVTNRHLVRGRDGAPPRRIAVIFSDTRDWLPAHIDRVAADGDLAVLRIDREGPFPFVSRVSVNAPAVGAPVAIMGFPLGAATPMDGSTDGLTARSTLGVGTVSKSIPGVLQIDAFASEGSSGSPVFSEDGSIAGLVYGGAPEAAGKIVYAIPGAAIARLLQ
ncbi:MAG TPA: trypsin-like peptidase domain-containing protein [Gemmatimonadaceae bacterium]|nr:trypsin-like peptidase domain-containing protein [Gemmatimonadaceae bacterium]